MFTMKFSLEEKKKNNSHQQKKTFFYDEKVVLFIRTECNVTLKCRLQVFPVINFFTLSSAPSLITKLQSTDRTII